MMNKSDRRDSIAALHRDNIIAAAGELFVDKGFSLTTMDEISAHAQYSKRTIYTYFESKDEIYSYFVAAGAKDFSEELKKAVDSTDNLIERYHNICNVMLKLYNEQFPYYEGIMKYLNQEHSSDASPVVQEIYDVGELINATLEKFFKDGQAQGIILQNVDVRRLAFIVWTNLIAFIEMCSKRMDYIKGTLSSTSEEFTSFGFNIILNSVLDAG